jgi:ArsR family transcriptional regulator, arsenate/arsenite/antimonite-responsive transcriptional repressor
VKQLSKIFKALSDTNRLRILRMLHHRPLCVCEMREILQLAVSTVSAHLSILKEAGLIVDEKDNKWVNYSLNVNSKNPVVKKMLTMLVNWTENDTDYEKDLEKINLVDRNTICGG